MTALPAQAARAANVVFWDFDGVIKESVDVKTEAFVQLFAPYGFAVCEQVRSHHQANGGMSRFLKIPLYLRLAGEEPTDDRVRQLCQSFGDLVRQAVIDSPWVPGAEDRLRNRAHAQTFVLISATPLEELKEIVQAIGIASTFRDVFGAPTSKVDAIRAGLERHRCQPERAVMIGDARADHEAALANAVPFILRRHPSNASVFRHFDGLCINDMTEL